MTKSPDEFQAEIDELRLRLEGAEETLRAIGSGEADALWEIAKKNEAALRESENRIKLFIEYAPAALAMFDRDMKYQYASKRWCNDYGLKSSDLTGKSHYEVFPKISDQWKEAHRRGMEGEVLSAEADRFERADGSVQWIHWEIRPWLDSAELVGGIVIFSEDITERKQAEEAVRQSAKRLSDIYTSMSEGLAIHELICDESGKTVDYRITDVNPAFEKYTGLTQSQAIGKKASELYGTGEAPFLDRYAEVASTGVPSSFEVHFAPMNKHFHISVFQPEKGKFATIFQDITGRKQAEKTLRENRSDLARAQEVGGIGSWRLDVRQNVLTWSDENHRIFGIPKGTPLTYEIFLSTIHPEDRIYVDTQWSAALRGEPYDIEHRLVVDGEVKWVREKAFLELDEFGNLLGGFGITQDISQRKKAEEELQKAHDELELRVRERTSDLEKTLQDLQVETAERLQAVEALREKEQLLIQQNRQAAMGEMIGNIAHQWRQPLNTIGLMVQQLLLFYDIGEFNREFLENNVKSTMELIQHMSKTIDDFRNYFRPEKEKLEFKASEAIANTLSLMEGSLQSPKIDIEIVAQEDLVIYGYQNEFAQVLLNILINAKDALTEKQIDTPRVTITTSNENGRTVVTIADNAGGIPEEIIDKIFDPYFTTKGPQLGTGVGLFMSKAIIEKNMGGRLSVRNIADGAEFRIEVPYDFHS